MASLPPENVQRTHAAHSRSAHKLPICIIAPDVADPLNVGSLFRIADALGVEKLYLAGRSPVPPNPRIRKTSRATEQSVPHAYHAAPLALVAQLRAAGYLIASLELSTQSRDIRQASSLRYDKLALIVGSESTGVAQELLEASDLTLHIPMFGQNSSMNLATACAIGVFELARRFMPG
jgi:tRNA G18 (ribose-2'-O)-methylase SpoU